MIENLLLLYQKYGVSIVPGERNHSFPVVKVVSYNVRKVNKEAIKLSVPFSSMMFCVLLHELGHILSYEVGSYSPEDNIINREIQAWQFGEEFYSGSFPLEYNIIKSAQLDRVREHSNT